MATAARPAAEPEALKHLFCYLVNSIDTAALLPAALADNLITDRPCYNEADPYKKAETFVGYLQRAVNADYDLHYRSDPEKKRPSEKSSGNNQRAGKRC